MRKINSKQLKILQWLILILTFALMGLWMYFDIKFRKTPVAIIFLFTFLFCLLIISKRFRENFDVKNGEILRFGKKTNFNMISVTHLFLGALLLSLSIYDIYKKQHIPIQVSIGIGLIISGIMEKTRYYLKFTKKYVSKYDWIFIRLNQIESIEEKENMIELKSKNKRLEISLNEIDDYEKEKFFEIIENLKSGITALNPDQASMNQNISIN